VRINLPQLKVQSKVTDSDSLRRRALVNDH
jgi:hypothetical protein